MKLCTFTRVGLAIPMYRFAKDKKAMSAWIRRELESAGCMAVKMGQWVSSRTDIFPQELADELASLRTDVAPLPYEDVSFLLPPSVLELLATIDPTPVSSGSIAQVHRGTTKDGRDVAIKIQRPHIDRDLRQDLRLATMVLGPYRWVNPKMHEDTVGSLEELVATVSMELDFVREGKSMGRFRKFFKKQGLPVKVPKVIAATPTVLVMEYEASSGSPRDIALLMETFVRTLLDLGYIHTDLHEGNLGTTDDGRMLLYDFGSVLRCDASLILCIKHLLVAYLNRSPAIMIDYLLEFGVLQTPDGHRVLEIPADERSMLEQFLEHTLAYVETNDTVQFATMVKSIELPQASTVVFRSDLAMVFRSFSLMEGLCKKLNPDFKIIEALEPLVSYFAADPAMIRYKIEDDLRTILRRLS